MAEILSGADQRGGGARHPRHGGWSRSRRPVHDDALPLCSSPSSWRSDYPFFSVTYFVYRVTLEVDHVPLLMLRAPSPHRSRRRVRLLRPSRANLDTSCTSNPHDYAVALTEPSKRQGRPCSSRQRHRRAPSPVTWRRWRCDIFGFSIAVCVSLNFVYVLTIFPSALAVKRSMDKVWRFCFRKGRDSRVARDRSWDSRAQRCRWSGPAEEEEGPLDVHVRGIATRTKSFSSGASPFLISHTLFPLQVSLSPTKRHSLALSMILTRTCSSPLCAQELAGRDCWLEDAAPSLLFLTILVILWSGYMHAAQVCEGRGAILRSTPTCTSSRRERRPKLHGDRVLRFQVHLRSAAERRQNSGKTGQQTRRQRHSTAAWRRMRQMGAERRRRRCRHVLPPPPPPTSSAINPVEGLVRALVQLRHLHRHDHGHELGRLMVNGDQRVQEVLAAELDEVLTP